MLTLIRILLAGGTTYDAFPDLAKFNESFRSGAVENSSLQTRTAMTTTIVIIPHVHLVTAYAKSDASNLSPARQTPTNIERVHR